MAKHLQSCLPNSLQKKSNDQKSDLHPFFLIQVSGRYATDYWLYLKVSRLTTLKVLDNFLRDIWLECCGHLSHFAIGGGWTGQELPMSTKARMLFKPGLEMKTRIK